MYLNFINRLAHHYTSVALLVVAGWIIISLSKGVEILRYVNMISEYHRIPGSPGFKEAVEAVSKIVEETEGTVDKIMLDDTVYFTHNPGWRVVEAWLSINDKPKWFYKDTPTLLAAYSPPSNGEVEGEIVEINRESGECNGLDGKVVLTNMFPGHLYRKCGDLLNDAIGIIFYLKDKDRTPTGFPYVRVESRLWGRLKPPVLTMPRQFAPSARKARLFVETKTDSIDTPIIKYTIPGKDEREIVVISHICHPRPGANDNASGASVTLWLAKYFTEKYRKNSGYPLYSLTFVWVPEYVGTFYALEQGFLDREKIIFTINLDMVGGNPALNGGILQLIESSPSAPGVFESVVYDFFTKELVKTKSFSSLNKLSSIPHRSNSVFEMGSDHDVFASYGIEAVMINQWPDKFYHTSEDSPDKISPLILEVVADATSKSLDFISNLTAEHAENLGRMMWRKLFASLERLLEDDKQIGLQLRSLQKRLHRSKTSITRLGDESLRKYVYENIERMDTLVESLEKVFYTEQIEPCSECGIRLRKNYNYIPTFLHERLSLEEYEKYTDFTTRTILVEAYRLMDGEMSLCEIEEYLRGYYNLDKETYCRVKDLIEKLVSMNIATRING